MGREATSGKQKEKNEAIIKSLCVVGVIWSVLLVMAVWILSTPAEPFPEYTPEEETLFTELLYSEVGNMPDDDVVISIAWAIRNNADRKGGIEEAIFEPYSYGAVHLSEKQIRFGNTIITEEMVPERIRKIAKKVLRGNIPSPIEDDNFFIYYDWYGCETAKEFTETYLHIEEYREIGNIIFFKN